MPTTTPLRAFAPAFCSIKPASRPSSSGHHVIAVQIVDNDGLSATEVVRLHVNGEVQAQ